MTQTAAVMVAPPAEPGQWGRIGRRADVEQAAAALASGTLVGAAFGNLYALVSRADEATVRGVNLAKGRPAGQVGSITALPSRVPRAWDLDRLPAGLDRQTLQAVVAAFMVRGPLGFVGPAAPWVPRHLRAVDDGVTTAQVIVPGVACPGNGFFRAALRATGDELLYVTSANRSRHFTGAEDSPAHWRAAGLMADFGHLPGFRLLAHDDESRICSRYPGYRPTSTSVLALHRTTRVPGDDRPHLTLVRHGSMAFDDVRAVLAGFGLGLVLGPLAQRRLEPREYPAEEG